MCFSVSFGSGITGGVGTGTPLSLSFSASASGAGVTSFSSSALYEGESSIVFLVGFQPRSLDPRRGKFYVAYLISQRGEDPKRLGAISPL